MRSEQALMGIAIAIVSLVGLASDRWFLERTRKGQSLVRWFGESRGLWVLRALFAGGAAFGTLLAMDVVRPMNW